MTYRIQFVNVSESTAFEHLHGLIGGDGTNPRTATVDGVVTGWIDCDADRAAQMDDELNGDDDVVAYA
jgi:hypothetical protein